MANTVASRKGKGRRLQQEVVARILATFDTLDHNDLLSIPGGVPGPDVWLSSKATDTIGKWDIECKNTEKLSIWAALEQVTKRLAEAVKPVLIFKRNHSDTYATIRLEDFLSLVANQRREDESQG